MSVANLHKLTALVVQLIEDGVKDIDTIVNIIGRKMLQLYNKAQKEHKDDIFVLLIITDSKISSFLEAYRRQL